MFVLIFLALLVFSSTPSHADYTRKGDARGSFCTFFGFACTFKVVDAVATPPQRPQPLPTRFAEISSKRPTSDGLRCWVNVKPNTGWLGWFSEIYYWFFAAPFPVYYARVDGNYQELGTPEFIVFSCSET